MEKILVSCSFFVLNCTVILLIRVAKILPQNEKNHVFVQVFFSLFNYQLFNLKAANWRAGRNENALRKSVAFSYLTNRGMKPFSYRK